MTEADIAPFETISYEVADSIATITLDRPEVLNALNPAMERELLQVWDLVDDDDDVRAVVVTGRGRAFCAGADLSDAGAGSTWCAERRCGVPRRCVRATSRVTAAA